MIAYRDGEPIELRDDFWRQDRLGIPTSNGLIRVQIDPKYKSKCVYSPDGLGPTVTSKTGGGHEPKILVKGGSE